MRINYLQVKGYKNLPETAIKFDTNFITLLVGQNGMGKSNLLEVLAKIFAYSYDVALGWENVNKQEKPKFDFILDYECNGIHFQMQQQKKIFGVFKYTGSNYIEPVRMSLSEIRKNRSYLPSQIFVYYSGDNRRVEELYKKSIRKEHSTRRLSYSKGEIVENPRHIITVASNHGILILLTLLVFRHNVIYKKVINKVLDEVMNIEVSDTITLKIESPSFAHIKQRIDERTLFSDYYEDSEFRESVDEKTTFWGIKGSINTFLHYVLEYAQRHSSTIDTRLNDRKTKEEINFYDFAVDEVFCKDIFRHFDSPISFFNMINEMDSFRMIGQLSFNINKKDDKGNPFTFDNLSEGEQQYLTVMGLMALNSENSDESLYLLDEPDTHINPKWQREYIKNIEEVVRNKDKELFFISTHSPFLVQAYNGMNVSMLLFKCNDNGKIQIDKDVYSLKNWRIDQVLLSPYFGFQNARPVNLDKFMAERNAIIERGPLTDEGRAELEKIADEEGYLPTGESIVDVEAMSYINSFLKESRNK